MYAHEYIGFFTKYEYFMYFLVSRFSTRFFAGSGPVHILGFVGSMTGQVPITLVDTWPQIKSNHMISTLNKIYQQVMEMQHVNEKQHIKKIGKLIKLDNQ